MDISVSDNKLRSAIEDEAACRRQYGSDMAKKIMLRLLRFEPPNRSLTFGLQTLGQSAVTN